MSEALKREYSFRDLILFHITAIVTLRWISFAAARGPSSLSLWFLSFFFFLLPIAYVVLDFSRRMPVEGGLYQWTKNTLGPFHGFICAWCYVVNKLFYFPSLLVTIAGYAAYTLATGKSLQNNTQYVMLFSLIAFWVILFLNLIGVRFGKWVQNIGGLAIWIPGSLLILLGIVQYFRAGSATTFTASSFFPNFHQIDTWSAWSQICFAFTGIELASTMSEEIKDPERSIPKSIYVAGVIITAIYILGTLSVLITIGSKDTNLVTGILQAISAVFASVGFPHFIPLIAVLLSLGGLGTLAAWLAGAARLPYTVGVDNYLPKGLAKLHPRFRTPYISLITIGIITSIIIWISFAGASVKQAYLALANATIILYFIPFMYLFISHIRYNAKTGNKKLAYVLAFAGLVSTVIAIILSCIPPSDANATSYLLVVVGGSFGMIVVSLFFYFFGRRK